MVLGLDLVVNDSDPGDTPSYSTFDWAKVSGAYGHPNLWRQIELVDALPADAVAVRASTPVMVDGSLSDWSGATAVPLSGPASSATAYLSWDATNLYVAFNVADATPNAIQTVRDASALWADDGIEIYVDTLGDRAATMQPDDYQFQVNRIDTQGDLRGAGGWKDPSWNGVWSSAVAAQPGGYVVEVAIPWAQIGVTPVSGMIIGVDLVVNDSAATYTTYDWAGISGGYGRPSLWKRVRLVDGAP
jgi:hypothetical protein